MSKKQYISPKLLQCHCYCERGYSISTDIDGWEDGDNRDGDAE